MQTYVTLERKTVFCENRLKFFIFQLCSSSSTLNLKRLLWLRVWLWCSLLIIYLRYRTLFVYCATLQDKKKRISICRPMLAPLCLNLSCSLASVFTGMASKCHSETFMEITAGKLHPLVRQGQCYMGEGQFPKCSDSSVSISVASARTLLETKLKSALVLQTTLVTWWYQTVKSL